MSGIGDRLAHDIAANGPMPVAQWMAVSNAYYYATRDPFGAAGDFVTAPEISQLFGELVGAWLADQWLRAGSPSPSRVVELGPGNGTMMSDMLRSMAAAKWQPEVVFIETSPHLAAVQSRHHPRHVAHPRLSQVADDQPLFLVANEFFDALPVHQFERTTSGWHERMVGGDFARVLAADDATASLPAGHAGDAVGSVVETSPASTAIAAEIGARLAGHGGAALIVDYGHAGPATGDTLQAVRGHARADPFADPGESDLTCHVDFTALAVAAAGSGIRAWGPVGQGDFLRALGIDLRAAALKARASADDAAAVDAAVARLTAPEAMGTLFKVMALTAPSAVTAAAPPGFA